MQSPTTHAALKIQVPGCFYIEELDLWSIGAPLPDWEIEGVEYWSRGSYLAHMRATSKILIDHFRYLSEKNGSLIPAFYPALPILSAHDREIDGEWAYVEDTLTSTGKHIVETFLHRYKEYQVTSAEQAYPTGDPKFVIIGNKLCNAKTREPIPDDEPIMIFRAKDSLAVPTIEHYGHFFTIGTAHHNAIMERVRSFLGFKKNNPDRMKHADT